MRMYDSKYYSMYLNLVCQMQAPEIALIQPGYNVMAKNTYDTPAPSHLLVFTGLLGVFSGTLLPPKKIQTLY